MPGIEDPRFEQALVLVCAHTPEHAMGITLNRPLDGVTVPDLLDRLGVKTTIELPPQLVLAGGPVERERGFVLHTDDFRAPDSTVPVAEGVSLTATRDVLQAMGDPALRPHRSTLALGYAGWGPGQLEREIRENVWLTCDVRPEPGLRRRLRREVGPGAGEAGRQRRDAVVAVRAAPEVLAAGEW